MSKIFKIARTVTIALAAIFGVSMLTSSSEACDAAVYTPKRTVNYYRATPKSYYQSVRSNHWSDVYHLRNSRYRYVRSRKTTYTREAYWAS